MNRIDHDDESSALAHQQDLDQQQQDADFRDVVTNVLQQDGTGFRISIGNDSREIILTQVEVWERNRVRTTCAHYTVNQAEEIADAILKATAALKAVL